jgi:hypothetical protein
MASRGRGAGEAAVHQPSRFLAARLLAVQRYFSGHDKPSFAHKPGLLERIAGPRPPPHPVGSTRATDVWPLAVSTIKARRRRLRPRRHGRSSSGDRDGHLR